MKFLALFGYVGYAWIGLAEQSLIETVAETLTGLGNLFFYLVVEFGYVFLDQDVGAIALLAVAVVDQRIIEGVHMSGCLPYSGMHENRGINTYDIFMKKGHGVPPIPFDIIFQLHAVLTIVINGRQTIVNFA